MAAVIVSPIVRYGSGADIACQAESGHTTRCREADPLRIAQGWEADPSPQLVRRGNARVTPPLTIRRQILVLVHTATYVCVPTISRHSSTEAVGLRMRSVSRHCGAPARAGTDFAV